jgi:hypothetical protein
VNIALVLALVFMVLGYLVERSGGVSVAEAWILFLAGLFFWSSGIGASVWQLIDAVYHAVRGSR